MMLSSLPKYINILIREGESSVGIISYSTDVGSIVVTLKSLNPSKTTYRVQRYPIPRVLAPQILAAMLLNHQRFPPPPPPPPPHSPINQELQGGGGGGGEWQQFSPRGTKPTIG